MRKDLLNDLYRDDRMPGQIDLHMHSAASDGTDTPFQLAEKVKAAGIKVFALTDHDTVAGAEELLKNPPVGVTFLPGIEFSCRMDIGKCHILGYCCDTAHPAFQTALKQGAALREGKLNLRLDFLQKRGVTFPAEELDKLRLLPSVGKPYLGNLMVKYGYAASRNDAIRDVINLCPTSPSRISAETAVKAILASGGIPVWAHPLGGEGEKETGPEQFSAMLDELTGYGIMGLECFYSRYQMSVCERLAAISQEKNLLISGGSDYHGTNKGIALGTLNKDSRIVSMRQLTILDRVLKFLQ